MGVYNNLPCSIGDVVDLVGIQVVRNTGKQLHCRCPFCDDAKAHLNIKLSKDIFRCNRCGQGGGVLHLYAGVNNISLNTAYEELCRIFKNGEELERRRSATQQRKVVTPTEADLASSEVRHCTYSNLLSLLTLGSAHRESLLARGLSGEAIDRLSYRTTPAVRSGRIVTELLERGCVLEGVPGFYRDKETGGWKLDIRASGIMIPDRNRSGEIEAIQIRLDRPYKSKFNNLTSVDRYYGTTAACCPHYAGTEEILDSVFLTEGVMKADIAHYLSLALGQPRNFIGLTGVGNINQYRRMLTELSEMGVKRIVVAFDMDRLINENVRSAQERVLQEGHDAGFEMSPISWDPAYKGIDDLLLSFRVS